MLKNLCFQYCQPCTVKVVHCTLYNEYLDKTSIELTHVLFLFSIVNRYQLAKMVSISQKSRKTGNWSNICTASSIQQKMTKLTTQFYITIYTPTFHLTCTTSLFTVQCTHFFHFTVQYKVLIILNRLNHCCLPLFHV